MSECTVLELREKLTDEKGINLIDVREYAEFANGRLKQARHIPFAEVGKLHEELDASEPIYLIDQNGKKSAAAQDMLKVIGFNNVINVRGGLDAWQAADFPIEKDEDAPWDLERQTRLAAGVLVVFGVVAGLFVHWTFVLISAVVGAALIAAAVVDSQILGQILLRMPWNQKRTTATVNRKH